MGLFGGRKSPEDRQREALEMAEKIGQGKGFAGRMTKAFAGSEAVAQIGQSAQQMRDAQMAAQLAGQGVMGAVAAKVLAVADTGKLVNFDPIVDLVLEMQDGSGSQFTLQTLVSKIQIPRIGDTVSLLPNPQQPGTYLYGGLAL